MRLLKRTTHSYYAPLLRPRSVETEKEFKKRLSDDLTEPTCTIYTGLGLDGFSKLVTSVSPSGPNKVLMTTADQVLLTMMKLRLAPLYFDLAIRFGISVCQAGKVFYEMLEVLQSLMQKIVWLPMETTRATMPQSFVATGYGSTSTEIYIQRPKQIYARGQTYSSYKGGNTIIFLVAVAPSGFVMFVSGGYVERASDKFIVENLNFTDYLCPNQVVMADRGFALTAEMKEKVVMLNIPAFTSRSNTFKKNFKPSNSRRACHTCTCTHIGTQTCTDTGCLSTLPLS